MSWKYFFVEPAVSRDKFLVLVNFLTIKSLTVKVKHLHHPHP